MAKLIKKILSKNALLGCDFIFIPETDFCNLPGIKLDGLFVIFGSVEGDELSFTGRFPDVPGFETGPGRKKTNLFERFPSQGLRKTFTPGHMPPYSSIPFIWLDYFHGASLLKKKTSIPVNNLEMNYGVQNLCSVVALVPRDLLQRLPFG